MGDGSRRGHELTLKDQWQLFWEGLSLDQVDDQNQVKETEGTENSEFADFQTQDLPAMTEEFFEEMTKHLSLERQKAHQQLEKMNKEIELLNAKMESLKLVGGDLEESHQRMNELTESGFALTGQLEKLDHKLKVIRQKHTEAESQEWI